MRQDRIGPAEDNDRCAPRACLPRAGEERGCFRSSRRRVLLRIAGVKAKSKKRNLHLGIGNRADLRFQLLHPRVVADPLVVDHFETSVVLI